MSLDVEGRFGVLWLCTGGMNGPFTLGIDEAPITTLQFSLWQRKQVQTSFILTIRGACF
jgi:hypothetical protein